MRRVLAKPADNQVVVFGCGCPLHHFKVEINTRTHTHRRAHVTETSYQAAFDALAHTRTHTHTLQRYGARFDNRQADLALVRAGAIQEKQSGPARGLGLLCLWSVTLHHEGNL